MGAFMTEVGLLRMAIPRTRRVVRALAPAAICLVLGGCSVSSSGLNNETVRDNNKVYSYSGGKVHCNDGRKIPYHPTDYEKTNGFSLPAICGYH
jgi:hypothetical protein